MINTHDPLTVDTDLANTVDILDACTDLTYLIENFPTEVSVSNIYNFIRSSNNPIDDEVKFFIDLHNGALNTKDHRGGINSNLDLKKTKVKNINDQLPDNQSVRIDENLNYSSTGDTGPIAKAEVYRSVIDEDGSIAQEDSTASYIPIPLADDINLKDTAGFTDFDKRFKVYWLDKFQKSHTHVQQEVKKALGENNIYYLSFSDSIGSLGLVELAKEKETSPNWDVDCEEHTPSVYRGTVNHLVDQETRMLMIEMSQRTTTIFRRNISHLGEFYIDRLAKPKPITASRASKAHGINLVGDKIHYNRVYALMSDFDAILRGSLKGMYDVLNFIRNSEEASRIGKPEITKKVESMITKVDWLGNKLNRPRPGTAASDERSNSVLS